MGALYDSKTKTMFDHGVRYFFTDEAKYRSWIYVEVILAQSQAELGYIPDKAAKEITKKAKYENLDFKQMEHIYERVGHGFVPFVKVLADTCGEAGKYIHYGVTTQNIQQTSELLIIREVDKRFMMVISEILDNLAKLAASNSNTVMPGRTHGKHAVPITFGFKVAGWIQNFLNDINRLQELESRVFNSMMGGAVGAYNSMGEYGPKINRLVAKKLDMKPMPIPLRNISAQKIEYMNALCLLATSCDRIAQEVYATSIEEYGEVSEPFFHGTIGSSTMPHKINPKLSKGIIANAQKLYSVPVSAYYSSTRPFEADSSSNMLFDGLLNESLELVTEVLLRTEELTRGLQVHKTKMDQNAHINDGLDNSEYVMMKVAQKLGKDQAHSMIYKLAMEAEQSDEGYEDVLLSNEYLRNTFSKEELECMLKPEKYTGLSSEIAIEFSKKAKIESDELKKRYKKRLEF
ncbi:class-II fumarase/aspartase family protein [Companilactobacillus heilongjiangensis]|uniref:Adenylosuccinate lyase n=1 Tax=Companilactobacillus heilongjiangensis TaxID=1074467 RepID=A0A0K2L9E9_9LACO|nr:adenylosuccinate lyase family protein [Companilactobacillus heilongjiangensis]ALB27911.1 adenylosuccinate lyase [Companilactobacillus heilongjiangensis]